MTDNKEAMNALLNEIKMILTGAHNIDVITTPDERINIALAVIESRLRVL